MTEEGRPMLRVWSLVRMILSSVWLAGAELRSLAGLGAALLWAAFPPLDFWPLAFVAPVPWLLIVRQRELAGRRTYGQLWLAGLLFWLATLHWVRLSHPAAWLGWIALAMYFACYLPLFVWLSRVAVHRLSLPLILAAPMVWTGLELLRGHLLTGMTMASLGHTQYRFLALIQLSDLGGAYAVSLVVMLVAAAIARAIPWDEQPWALRPLAVAAGVLGAALGYGAWRMGWVHAAPPAEPSAVARIALIQGNIPTTVKFDEKQRDHVLRHYLELTALARWRFGTVDAIVWPETMYRYPLLIVEPGAQAPDWLPRSTAELKLSLPELAEKSRTGLFALARQMGVPWLVGIDVWHFVGADCRFYNSAVLVMPEGAIAARYDKMHLVVFGEYVPLAGFLPVLKKLTPIDFQCRPGDGPVAFQAGPLRMAPSICYETVLPHVIRHQVLRLRRQGQEPDVLVNLTNDGWFWGSSELDMHLACGVFRAVECRKPLLVAANTGFSAWIDGDGRILRQGPRAKPDVLLAEVMADRRRSWYLDHGDWLAGVCLAACVVFGAVGLWPCVVLTFRRLCKPRILAHSFILSTFS